MSDAAEILKSVQIGLNVVIFLLNTDRGLQAIELCKECVILLQNLDSGSHLDICDVLFNTYYAISGYTDAGRHATKLLDTFNHAWSLIMEVGDIYISQSRFIEAKQLFKCALTIMKTIGHKREEALAHGRLGSVSASLSKYQKAKEYREKALAIAIEIGDRRLEGTTYGSLGIVFHSLGEYQNAKEYLEKALAIGIEIGDRNVEGTTYGNLGKVFHSLETGDRGGEGTTYGNLGSVFNSIGEYQNAKEYHEKALAIAIEIGDRRGEGTTYRNLGCVFGSLGEYQNAKEHHEKALAIAIEIEIGDKGVEGRTYGNLGSVFHFLGECQNAKEYYEKALAIRIEIGDRGGEGTTYGNLGKVFHSLGEYQNAKEYHKKALAIRIEIGDRGGEGATYASLGCVFYSLCQYQNAKEYHEKALAIAIEIGDKGVEGRTYGNLGSVFHFLGECQNAKEYYEKALAIAIEIGDKGEEGTTYGNLGKVFHSLGEYQNAKEYHKKALAIRIEIGDRGGEGATYASLGCVFYSLCEYQNAKEYHEKALAIAMEIGDRAGEGTTYGNLGKVFDFLGEYQNAKEYYEKALAIAIEIGDRRGEGSAYLNLGMAYRNLEKNRQAKEHLDKAVDVSIAIGDRELEAKAIVCLAHVYNSVNDSQKAKEHCEKALTISRECGNRKCEAEVSVGVGRVSLSFGEYDKAAYYLQKACSISSEIGHKSTEFESLLCITVLKLSQLEVVEAIEYLLQCIEKYEQIRTLQKGNSGFEISLLEKCGTFPFELLTRLLCGTGKFRDALYVEELGRARVLAEFMADKYSAASHISADPRSWFGIENIARRESNCVFLYISYEDRRVLLWVLKANGDIFFRETDEVKIDTLIAERVCEVEGVFKKSAECFGVLPTANCEDRSLDDNVTTSLHEESQANLRGDETKDTGRSHHLCYEWIVAPVDDLLTEPEIIIVPDSFSYRVPFAALRDEQAGKYLSEKCRIRIVPSLTTLRLIQECPADYHSQTGGLVVGDPTVGKVQYNGRLIDITPLFCASKEAEIVGQLLGVQPLLGSRATKQAVLQAIPSVSLIHLAAHGNAARGEIALSPKCTTNSTPQEEDYLLKVSDIEGVQVRAKLVVLSCCHSGRGLVKKEGVIGIARAFLASGARSVLVASWAIEDKATAKLMKQFYKHLVRGESASESLHQAVQWLRSNRFSKPSQWAPFVLMGDNVTFDFTKKGKEELEEDINEAEKKQSDY
ncbi:tetratricopeptide repeat protein 28-like [Pocillopora verrucosa]|uniref:tetratricopeptide repeat protein 28-like n=1 Tax=Pocillopora verrucosa TaxID=203993 RepID=UPI00333F5A77